MAEDRRTRRVEDARKTKVVGDGAPAGGEAPAGWLVPRSGKQAGQIFALQTVNVIGADPEQCHIHLDEDHVSSRHAELTFAGGVWTVKDLGSTNGTRVGDGKLAGGERFEGLRDGDVLAFGTLEVTFKCA